MVFGTFVCRFIKNKYTNKWEEDTEYRHVFINDDDHFPLDLCIPKKQFYFIGYDKKPIDLDVFGLDYTIFHEGDYMAEVSQKCVIYYRKPIGSIDTTSEIEFKKNMGIGNYLINDFYFYI
jgi:hypothetical protein